MLKATHNQGKVVEVGQKPQYRAITVGGAREEELGAFTAGPAGMKNYLQSIGLAKRLSMDNIRNLIGSKLSVEASVDPVIDFKHKLLKKSTGQLHIKILRLRP